MTDDVLPATASVETVEAVVRRQLSQALGGRRGMIEAAVPTIAFTVLWLTTRELNVALVVSVSAAVLLLVVRLVQRSSVQFVVNAMVGIGIGWLFVARSAASGGSKQEQALAYFLPGILYNTGYTVVLALTCLIGWPVVGFMVGSVTGDATGWHRDRQVVEAVHAADVAARAAVPGARGRAGADLAGRQLRVDGPRHRGRDPRGAQDRAGLAAPARRARRDGVGAGAQPHADDLIDDGRRPSATESTTGPTTGPSAQDPA